MIGNSRRLTRCCWRDDDDLIDLRCVFAGVQISKLDRESVVGGEVERLKRAIMQKGKLL